MFCLIIWNLYSEGTDCFNKVAYEIQDFQYYSTRESSDRQYSRATTMNYLLKQRRLFATLVTILCVIYSSHVTIQIMAGVSQHQECFHVNDDATRHIMTKNYKMDEIVASLTRDDLSDGNESPTRKENRSYRLDIVKDDLAKISENNNGAEAEEEIRTNYFTCADFDRIPRTRKEVEENLRGNRAISFIKVRIDGVTIPAVIKEANR